ncbi:hypothetical protein BU24DRAFT_410340 [Aaosphaeria arxii CBS 175.79]|uniref:Uncharacterized protein n=1 Tax=Aaosphaeria arxii CBS 175.79 TaxID=1450172 RepID=A0A6A5XPC0_9PLEO|nr:uncharacterized protein BU24DRAFT_410340 [Aaosphaeria arxii CBS 175.79]KAF2014611.1 hypothetical protein BU24DRAFT_410340 [Aaosphaeria arxii CBS 175.79]
MDGYGLMIDGREDGEGLEQQQHQSNMMKMLPIPFSIFPSSYRSQKESSTQEKVEGSKAQQLGQGEGEYESFSTHVQQQQPQQQDNRQETYVKEEIRIHEEQQPQRPRPANVHREEIHIHEQRRPAQPQQHREEIHIEEHRFNQQPQPQRSEFKQHEFVQHQHQYQQPEQQRSTKERVEVEYKSQDHYQQPYDRYVGSHIDVKDRSYDRDFNTVHGPATDYAPTQIDVSERQYRERTRPIEGGYSAEFTNLSTQPNLEQASSYSKQTYTGSHDSYPSRRENDSVDSRYPRGDQVRVEKSTRSTVDAPKKFKRDMGYYDSDGQYHSFRQGLHKAADRVAERVVHPFHSHRHHHSHHQPNVQSAHREDREEIVVKEKYTHSIPAPGPTSAPAPAPAPSRAQPQPPRFAPTSSSTHISKTIHQAPRKMAPANTITIPCHHIRIGDLLILQGRPCQVIRITTSSQTGQHRYLGVDLFTKQLHEESSFISNPAPSVVVQNMLGPVFKQYRVLDIREDGRVVAMTETGDVKQGLPIIDQSGLLTRLTESFDNGRGSVRVLVINDDGQELAVDYKVVHGSRL